jgi:hypothetical protein
MKHIFLILLLLLFMPLTEAGKITYRAGVACGDKTINPFFTCNNKVYVQTVDKNTEIKINDLVCFNHAYKDYELTGWRYMCERVYSINGGVFKVKDNNNIFWNFTVLKKDIALRVVRIE